MEKIKISNYSDKWPTVFEELREVFEFYLGSLICGIYHVGSTSVAGLAAKPIIDIDLEIDSDDKLQKAILKLKKLGYIYLGDLGIKNREAFKQENNRVPLTKKDRVWHKHNLYVCSKGALSIQNHLAFRDFLRANPDKAREYGELKKRIARDDPYGFDTYCMKKTPFILEILKIIGFKENEIKEIRMQNRYMKRI